jgi:hypothetical protein
MVVAQHIAVVRRDFHEGFSLRIRFSSPELAKPWRLLDSRFKFEGAVAGIAPGVVLRSAVCRTLQALAPVAAKRDETSDRAANKLKIVRWEI